VRYEHDVQDAINILWTAYSCLGISTAFSLPDVIIILLFQVTSFKESIFFIKVQINCQSPIEWAYYASGIGKPDLCCYCAAEGILQDNDLKNKQSKEY
jgi:predicted CDP-diglyceride synthetase/phosphatidate cytidylyltransferase